MKQELPSWGSHDPLTGLMNRRTFNARLQSALLAATPQHPVSLLLVNLDRFRTVNARHDLAAGDDVLRHLGGLLPSDAGVVSARVGGQEFAVIVSALDATEALGYADHVRESIAGQPTVCQGRQIAVTASIGVNTAKGPLAPRDFLCQAEEAVYVAKRRGRNRVEHYALLRPET